MANYDFRKPPKTRAEMGDFLRRLLWTYVPDGIGTPQTTQYIDRHEVSGVFTVFWDTAVRWLRLHPGEHTIEKSMLCTVFAGCGYGFGHGKFLKRRDYMTAACRTSTVSTESSSEYERSVGLGNTAKFACRECEIDSNLHTIAMARNLFDVIDAGINGHTIGVSRAMLPRDYYDMKNEFNFTEMVSPARVAASLANGVEILTWPKPRVVTDRTSPVEQLEQKLTSAQLEQLREESNVSLDQEWM